MSRHQFLCAATTTLCLGLFGAGTVAHANPIPDAPEAGVDLDLRHAVETANSQLKAAQPAKAAEQVLSLYLVSDRFTKAQRPQLGSESQGILREAGKQLVGAGQVENGLTALDGAWMISGKAPDPEYGKLLVDAAERTAKTNRAEALYMARRARQVDPQNVAAEKADTTLSTNRFKIPALIALIAGGVICVGGLGVYSYSGKTVTDTNDGSTLRYAGIGAALGGGLIAAGGGILLRWGRPVSEPVSPAYLPAFPDGR